MSDHRFVSAVVPVLNGMPELPRCVEAILTARRRFGDAEVLFVENGSTDGSREYLHRRLCEEPGARLLEHRGARVGAVRNFGAANARGDFLAFVDADCVVPDDHFEVALAALRRAGADAVGSQYALPDDPSWVERVWFPMHGSREDGPTNYLPGGNLFCRRTAFDDVGGFDPTLESGEDAELCQRLRSAGYRIHADHAVRVVHLGNAKSLSEHFGKQRWHGRGALGTARLETLDKPLLATVAHAGLSVLGAVLVALNPTLTGLAAGVAASSSVPLAAVLYRSWEVRRPVDPLRGTLLYWVYFGARTVALAEIAGRRIFAPQHPIRSVETTKSSK